MTDIVRPEGIGNIFGIEDAEQRFFPKGSTIFTHQAGPVTRSKYPHEDARIYRVDYGLVALQRRHASRIQRVTIGLAKQGDVIGAESRNNWYYFSTAITLEDSGLTSITVEQSRQPESEAIFEELANLALSQMTDYLHITTLGDVRTRTAKALVDFMEDGKVKVSQPVLADRVAVSRQTVNPALQRFVDVGAIAIDNPGMPNTWLTILDPDTLNSMVNSV